MKNSFLAANEISHLGLGSFGDNVLISRNATLINPENITLSDNVRIDDFAIVTAFRPVTVGAYVHIGAGAQIFGNAGCTIGNLVSVSPRAAIFTTSDDFSGQSLVGPTVPAEYRIGLHEAPVLIEDYSCIGTAATVMPGITMHEGAVCGAHGLVLGDCEAWSIFAGIPARRIKARSQDAKSLGAKLLGLNS